MLTPCPDSATACLEARLVLTSPDHAGNADLRLYAWALLKSDRGQTVRQTRLAAMQAAIGLRRPLLQGSPA